MSGQVCTFDGCEKPRESRWRCREHWAPYNRRRVCSVEGCEAPHGAYGVCLDHYAQDLAASESQIVLRIGVHEELEDAANEILHQSLVEITEHSDKADILTPWKEWDRRSREVLVPSGTPDAAVRRGIFHRSANHQHLHLNSVDVLGGSRSQVRTRRFWETTA